jgi:hypothetical protein
MESVVVNHPQSNHSNSSYTMLGTAVPSEPVYQSSSRQPAQSSSNLETGSSISTSSNTTPTFPAPPSASAAGSSRFSTQDVPAYIRASSHPSSRSSESSTVTPGPTPIPTSAQMNPPSVVPSGQGGQTGTAPPGFGGRHTASHSSPASPQLRPTLRSLRSLGGSEASSPSRIKIRDLSHIQSFASEEFLAPPQRTRASGHWAQERQFEISSMPVTDIIEMVAGLLTKMSRSIGKSLLSMGRAI